MASTLGVMAGAFDINKFAVPSGDAVFRAGCCTAISLSVLAAHLVAPGDPLVSALLFLLVRVRGDGACLFHSASVGRGSNPATLRRRVIRHLKRNWHQPCPAGVARRGHADTRTVGEALAEEHGRAFADGDEYEAWMHTRDAGGSVPWSTTVEACALATLEGCIVEVWTRTPDGGLAIRDVFFPDSPPTSPPIHLLHGSHGAGGGHFDRLLPLDSLSPDRAAACRDQAMGVSASAWSEARLDAAAAAMVYLSTRGMPARRDAEAAVGGAAALDALAREAAELEAARELVDGGMPHDAARDAAAGLVAMEAGAAPWDVVALLADRSRLRRAVSALLSSVPPATPAPPAEGAARGHPPLRVGSRAPTMDHHTAAPAVKAISAMAAAVEPAKAAQAIVAVEAVAVAAAPVTVTRGRATAPSAPFFFRLSCSRAHRPAPPHRICVTLRLRRIPTTRAAGAAELQGRREHRALDLKPFVHAPSQSPLQRTGHPSPP